MVICRVAMVQCSVQLIYRCRLQYVGLVVHTVWQLDVGCHEPPDLRVSIIQNRILFLFGTEQLPCDEVLLQNSCHIVRSCTVEE